MIQKQKIEKKRSLVYICLYYCGGLGVGLVNGGTSERHQELSCNWLISQVNGASNKKREENGFHFVSNGNILRKHLCEDGVNLTDEGKNIFAGNIVDYIRHFLLKEFWNEVACNDGHFEDQNRGIDKGSTENSSEKTDSNLKNNQDLNPLSIVNNLRLIKCQ